MDVDEDNGAMWVQSGSHKGRLLTGSDFSEDGEFHEWDYNAAVDELCTRNAIPETPVCVRRGDVVFFDGVLMHRGGPIGKPGSRTWHSLANHYIGHSFDQWTHSSWPRVSFDGSQRLTSEPRVSRPAFLSRQRLRRCAYRIPEGLLDDAIDAIWKFGELDPDDPQTWYRTPERANGLPELNGAGMVELYHHPALWATRQWPDVHATFSTLWQTEALWVSIDRCNFNPPNRGDATFEGFIHWDIDTSVKPLPFGMQGFLSLSDCPAGAGGFQCVPALYAQLDEWTASQPADRDPFRPELSRL